MSLIHVAVIRPDNGHISWLDAVWAAESMFLCGVRGRLASIRSAEENEAVFCTATSAGSQLNVSADQFWLGGYQPDRSDEPAGRWRWVGGVAWDFTNWRQPPTPGSPEPNDQYLGSFGDLQRFGISHENALHFADNSSRTWNDLPRCAQLRGYVVEFEIEDTIRK